MPPNPNDQLIRALHDNTRALQEHNRLLTAVNTNLVLIGRNLKEQKESPNGGTSE